MIKDSDLQLLRDIISIETSTSGKPKEEAFMVSLGLLILSSFFLSMVFDFSFIFDSLIALSWVFFIYKYYKPIKYNENKENQLNFINYLKIINKEDEKSLLTLLKFKKDIDKNNSFILNNLPKNQSLTYGYSALVPYLNYTDDCDLAAISMRYKNLKVKVDDFNIANNKFYDSLKLRKILINNDIDLIEDLFKILIVENWELFISYPALVFYNYEKLLKKNSIKNLVEQKEIVIKDLNQLKDKKFQEDKILDLRLTNLEKEQIRKGAKKVINSKEIKKENSKEIYI